MISLVLSFLAGLVIGGVYFYKAGKDDAFQKIADETMEGIRRHDHGDSRYRQLG